MTTPAVVYNKRSRAKAKRLLIRLKGGRCEKCRGKFPQVCYDFHHVDPRKKSFSFTASVSLERKIQEAKKCLLLCANCHRLEHERLRGGPR